jgi:hypothetical protein
MNHDSIRAFVEQKMNEDTKLRLHKNREKLWLLIKNEHPDEKISYGSVERAQRRLWEAGIGLPEDPIDLELWQAIRHGTQEEYKQAYQRCQRWGV